MGPNEIDLEAPGYERKIWMATRERERAKEYLLANPTATNRDAAAAVGCSPRTIGYARAELVNAGLIPPAWGDHKSDANRRQVRVSADTLPQVVEPPPEGTPFDTQSTVDLNAAISKQLTEGAQYRMHLDDIDTEEIDIEKLKRILWRIARTEPDNRIRTSAIWTLTRIQQDINARPLGPGVPRTKADIIDRFLQLFEGVGPAVVIEAMQTYLDKRRGTDAPKAVVEGIASSTSLETSGS